MRIFHLPGTKIAYGFVCALLLLSGACSRTQTTRPADRKQTELATDIFIHHYYEHPDPERLPEVFQWFKQKGLLSDFSKSGSVTGLFGGLLSRNPRFIPQYVALGQRAALNDKGNIALSMALWFCGTSECRDVLSTNPFHIPTAYYDETQQYAPKPFAEMPIPGPAELDILWGWFIATGDAEPVNRIISYVSEYEVIRGQTMGTGSMIPIDFTGESGRWSLISQAANHERVLKILKECAQQKPSCKPLLEEAEKRRANGKRLS